MQITQNSTSLMVFLLVDEEDQTTPMAGMAPAVRLSINGAAFVDSQSTVSEIGNGWYHYALTETETAEVGPIIVCASAPGSAEWRDIIYVAPRVSSDEIPQQPDPVEVEPAGNNLISNGDFLAGSKRWNLHSKGKATWQVEGDAAKITLGANVRDTQLYQFDIGVVPGPYELAFEARTESDAAMQVFLHKHQNPYTELGISELVPTNRDWYSFKKRYLISSAEPNARLRFWLSQRTSSPGATYRIRNVSLYRLA